MKKILLLTAVLVLWLVPNLQATPLSIRDAAVSGADMAGMHVTVEFDGGSTDTGTWQAGTGNLGFASGDDWGLRFAGSNTWFSNNIDDPYFPYDPDRLAYWELFSSTPVSGFTIDAMAGNVVFDIFAIWEENELGEDPELTGFPNSPGSLDGWWQENSFTAANTSGSNSDFTWEFSNPVAIGGVTHGDLFGTMNIDFHQASAFENEPFQFGVDTDLVVPEPTTIVLLSLGLLGMAGVARRQKQ